MKDACAPGTQLLPLWSLVGIGLEKAGHGCCSYSRRSGATQQPRHIRSVELCILITLSDQYCGLGNGLIAAAESVYFRLVTART